MDCHPVVPVCTGAFYASSVVVSFSIKCCSLNEYDQVSGFSGLPRPEAAEYVGVINLRKSL